MRATITKSVLWRPSILWVHISTRTSPHRDPHLPATASLTHSSGDESDR